MSTPISRAKRRTCGAAGMGWRCSVPATLPKLHRHGEGRRGGLRLVGRQRLFFGFAFGANRGLKCEARAVLSGNVFDGRVAAARAGGGAEAPPSSVKMTCPTLIFSPSLTFTSLTTPLTEDGTSTTALSVSSSITGWPSETFVPGAIIRRTRSPCEMFSPSSGSLNSLADCGWARRSRALRRGAADGSGAGCGAGACAASAVQAARGFGFGGAAFAAARARAFAPAPFSTVKITWPTLTCRLL